MAVTKQNTKDDEIKYFAPKTRYCKTPEEFNAAVGEDFIKHANSVSKDGSKFFVGLAHGQSPSGAYAYILEHIDRINHPELIYLAFTNSRLKSQSDLKDVIDARMFIRRLVKNSSINRDQILGFEFDEDHVEESVRDYNTELLYFMHKNSKKGFDYLFLATDPTGRVAGIKRRSKTFESEDIVSLIIDRKEKELTITPYFIGHAKRIAFLATKSDKRRSLAWLFSRWGSANESPSFLRYIDNVQDRMTVYIDDRALTWPQIELKRESDYGTCSIKIDFAKPYSEKRKIKQPVILLIHGFLGLNSYDGLLTAIPTQKYIAAAMHYGTIPDDLPPVLYSNHIVQNINHVVQYFGEIGHDVFIFDHSMGNIYFLMMDQQYKKLPGIQKYLRGRIGANPFFGEEAKHALLGFLDTVIIPGVQFTKNPTEKALLSTVRRFIPIDTKKGVRRRGIRLSKRMISNQSDERDVVWQAAKERILFLMSNLDSLPELNRIPISKALNRLPAKIFAIQIYSALTESKSFDKQLGLTEMENNKVPVLILKSKTDGVAKYVDRLYNCSTARVIDVTNQTEKDLFREHLYHMVNPMKTVEIISEFVEQHRSKEKK